MTSERTKPNRLTIEPAVDGGYVVNDNYNCLFAGSLKEALAYIEGRFDPQIALANPAEIRPAPKPRRTEGYVEQTYDWKTV